MCCYYMEHFIQLIKTDVLIGQNRDTIFNTHYIANKDKETL